MLIADWVPSTLARSVRVLVGHSRDRCIPHVDGGSAGVPEVLLPHELEEDLRLGYSAGYFLQRDPTVAYLQVGCGMWDGE